MTNRFYLFLICLLSITWMNAQVQTDTHFIEYNTEAGINHIVTHNNFMGGGAAFFDANNDGYDDVYITSGFGMDHFYVNNGDGTFSNKNIEAGLSFTDSLYTMGVIAGDIDNDGWKDLFVTTNRTISGAPAKNLLLYNNGDGTFEDIWTDALDEKVFSIGATFMDYNLDGLLDIYVVNYVKSIGFLEDDNGVITGFDHECYENHFYKNLGDGNFQEIGEWLGLDDEGCALAVTATDFDMDNDMDIYIANDFGEFIIPNRLYENVNSSFEDVSESTESNLPMYGMGIAIGDIDNDLDLDYYVTNFGKNRLISNEENVFEDVTDICGVGNEWIDDTETNLTVGWGSSFADIDNDKDLDLYVANGYVPSPSFLPSSLFMNDILYVNEGNMTFTEADSTYGITNRNVSRGMTHSDYDNDGDIDYLSVVLNVPVNNPGWYTVLYKNEIGNQKNWFQVTLEGIDVNRDAYGSKVYIHAGEETYIRELNGGASHCSHLSSKLHFGLDDITMVDSVTVIWTGGRRTQVAYDFEANQHIHIVEDTTITPLILTANTDVKLDQNDFNIFPNPAQEQIVIEYKNEVPAVEIYNAVGQLIPVELNLDSEQFIFINVDAISDGMYFIKLKIGHQLITQKVIIQRNE